MQDEVNQNSNSEKPKTEDTAGETTSQNAVDLNALLQNQDLAALNLNPADLNAMLKSMMSGQLAYDDDEDDEYLEDDDDLEEDENEPGVAPRQDAYQMAQSLMSSPLFSQMSALMGGPKLNETERLFNQGKTYQAAGALDEAAEAYLDVIDADPEHFRAHIGMGQVLLTLDRPLDAIPFLEQALELDPQDPGGSLYLGYAHYALGQYQACVLNFGRTVELDPYNQLALNNLGFAQFLAGQLEEAEQTFVRAGDAGSERAYYNLGMVRLLKGNEAAAWEAYQEAADLDPNGTQINDHLQDFDKAYEKYPNYASLLDQAAEKLQARLAELGYADSDDEDYDDAEDEYLEDYDDEADDGEAAQEKVLPK